MTVRELSEEQIRELKGKYIIEKLYKNEKDDDGKPKKKNWGFPSWGEMAEVDKLIADETIFEFYAGINFVDDDFVCTEN